MWDLMKRIWYRTPVIGKIASLSRKIEVTKDGWFQSEIVLCDRFHAQIHRYLADPHLYDKAPRYLQKVQEHGRRPMGCRQWFFIVALFLGEAMLFNVVLIPYLMHYLSPYNYIRGLMIGIISATVLAMILVGLTYKMGKVLHHRSLVKKARKWWFRESDKKSSPRITEANEQVGLSTNEKDDDQPRYIQLLNRIEHNTNATPGGRFWIAFTLGMILAIAAAAGYARYQTQQLKKAEDARLEERANSTEGSGEAEGSDEQSRYGEFGPFSPNDGISKQSTSDDGILSIQGQNKDDDRIKNWVEKFDDLGIIAYLIMAVFYFWIQYSGIRLGKSYSFVGGESRKAYKLKICFSSSEDFRHWKNSRDEEIGYKADEMLSALQTKLNKTALDKGVDNELHDITKKAHERNFNAYLLRKEKQNIFREELEQGEAR